jgi:hypothetical protein
MGYTPPGAAGVGGDEPAIEIEEEDRTFLEKISEIPGAIYGAVTGEGAEVEFPDIPEATELVGADRMARDFGFLEALIPNLKIMMVRDDVGKAEVLERSFAGDERFGGVFADKFDNPMIVWDDKPYYMNKPGFSEQDIGTFIGEFVKYIPASKFVKGASKLLGIAQRGIASYGATEVAGQAAEAILTPKTTAAGKSLSPISHKKLGSALALVWVLILQWPQSRRLSRLLFVLCFVLWLVAQSMLRENFQDMFALCPVELPH